MFTKSKKVLAIVASVLAFSSLSMGQASADQTVIVDLNNFQNDGIDNYTRQPFHAVYGVQAGDTITLNVSNSSHLIDVLLAANPAASAQLSTDDLLVGTVGPKVYEAATNQVISGSYTLTVTLGANFDLTNVSASFFANWSNSPENMLGLVYFPIGDPDGALDRSIHFLSSGTPNDGSPAVVLRSGNALRLDSVGTTTEKNNVVSCTPGKYTFLNGGTTAESAKVQSFVYTLLVNGTAVSTISSDGFKSVASHLFPTIAGNMAGTATLEGATWNLAGMSNYSAACQVYATQSGGNIQSVTSEVHDAVALAAQAEAAANVARNKEIISTWNASNEELAKKYRDQRLVARP